MKAGIITHYNVHNHGANLQMYALINELKKLGYDAKALQFQKNYDFMGGSAANAKYNISLKSIRIYLKYLFENGFKRTLYNYKKRKILSSFRSENGLVGEFYADAKNLDAVVIGSDEIFSIEAGPNPWYYGIGVPCKKQISYAASFGPTTLDMIEERNVGALIGAGMNNISKISVRDENSAQIVKHYTSKEPKIVCDPVLLHDFSEYCSEKEKEEFKKKHHEKYCIVYSYDYNMNDDSTVNYIKNFANVHRLKIYSLCYFHKWCDENINVSPLDVFKWFACSEMVFTDTFHGSVISLASETQFITKIRGNGNKLRFLLEQYEVIDRLTNDFSDIDKIIENPIDYDNRERKIIAQKRHDSFEYLKSALS